MEIGVVEILGAFGLLVLYAYYYLTSSFNYWKNQNVQGPTPSTLGGNMRDVVLGKTHISLLLKKYYDDFKSEPVIGIFSAKNNPSVLLRDLDLIKDVLIKDFNVFSDRGLYVDDKDDLSQNLLNLRYNKWRPLRNQLSPVFTLVKLRDMFCLIATCADNLVKYLEKVAKEENPIEFRELAAKFTIDSIGICAFGINANALDEHNELRKHLRTVLRNDYRRLLQEVVPAIYNLLGPFKYSKSMRFLISSMKETLDYRQKNGVRRNDFVDLLMDLQNESEKVNDIEFTDLFLISQALGFFAAGYETSASTISNTLYELALNHDIQDTLRKEIREAMEKDQGEVTYENIKKMKYLDKVVKETLRKYPTGSILIRRATAPYTFNGTRATILEDTTVYIPVWAIQRNPEIYPDPDKFDPERFDEENENSRHPMSYLPFGSGPRNCIGTKFANYQTKLGIIAVIKKFTVDVCEKTCVTYDILARTMLPTPIGGIYLKISEV